MARLAVFAIVVMLAAMPAGAAAVTNPFVPTPQQQAPPGQAPQDQAPQQAPAAPVQTTTTDSGGISKSQLLLLGFASIALIAGIWIVIARDARRAAPTRTRSRTSRTDPDALARAGGRSATRPSPRDRKPSPAERRRRKRGRAR